MITNFETLRHLTKTGAIVGGSFAQALIQGHRAAPDIDVFQSNMIPSNATQTREVNTWLTKATIDGQKYDLVKPGFHRFKRRFMPVNVAGINVLDIRDQAINKLEVICKRGRKTDYFDIYFMLRKIRFESMVKMYAAAFPEKSIKQLLQCLVYFTDVEQDETPATLPAVSWEEVKKTLSAKVKAFATFYQV